MAEFKVIEIKKSVFENNDREADKLRDELKKDKTFPVLRLGRKKLIPKDELLGWKKKNSER